MSDLFDEVALAYDQTWTQGWNGRGQRRRVWEYLSKLGTDLRVLEVACGTGEDALFMSELGWEVHATDSSERMIEQAKKKCASAKSVIFDRLDLMALDRTDISGKFDLVFSNFGGLNCLSARQLHDFKLFASEQLSPTGSLIFVLMPRRALLERWYNLLKRRPNSRVSEGVARVRLVDNEVETFYFDPDFIIQQFSDFQVQDVRALGFVPSYFSDPNSRKASLDPLWRGLDFLMRTLQVGPSRADHYLIHLKRPKKNV
ncbi:MAG: class I SAM-dependent methyltransferase [Saprospiraceae bacterium]|nr:class I SAM-dependent methyltransferase [Saprospiraceae bacterium]